MSDLSPKPLDAISLYDNLCALILSARDRGTSIGEAVEAAELLLYTLKEEAAADD